MLDGATSLLDKHLLRKAEQGDDAPRLLLHETIWEYGLEALVANQELEMAQRAHAAYYLDGGERQPPRRQKQAGVAGAAGARACQPARRPGLVAGAARRRDGCALGARRPLAPGGTRDNGAKAEPSWSVR